MCVAFSSPRRFALQGYFVSVFIQMLIITSLPPAQNLYSMNAKPGPHILPRLPHTTAFPRFSGPFLVLQSFRKRGRPLDSKHSRGKRLFLVHHGWFFLDAKTAPFRIHLANQNPGAERSNATVRCSRGRLVSGTVGGSIFRAGVESKNGGCFASSFVIRRNVSYHKIARKNAPDGLRAGSGSKSLKFD